MKMIKAKSILILLAIVILFSNNALAGECVSYLDIGKIQLIRGNCSFEVLEAAPKTCSRYGNFFTFNTETERGKTIYKTLLTAKVSRQKITIWYTPSTNPGTNEDCGCIDETMAIVYGIGFSK